jgi:hypothetical protein
VAALDDLRPRPGPISCADGLQNPAVKKIPLTLPPQASFFLYFFAGFYFAATSGVCLMLRRRWFFKETTFNNKNLKKPE